ncbi:sulfotransferase [Exilibacterium tricleocarpae]|nr:sulfotransferase [Exilibacterium tricleocarpae]
MPKNAIIVGVARSGTSMTSSIFTKKGYFVTEDENEDLRPADAYNPGGYWESETLIQENAKLFSAVGFPHDNTWMYDPISPAQADSIAALEPTDAHRNFVASYNKNSPWVWKDPRLCYTLGFWWPLLNPDSTAVILLKRDPEAIYQSFVRVKWREQTEAHRQETYERIRRHLAQAEKTVTAMNVPHIVVQYEDFKTQPERVLAEINQLFELDLRLQDLTYNDSYNHHSAIGRLGTAIDVLVSRLPVHWIKRIKRLTPTFLLKILYPERYK